MFVAPWFFRLPPFRRFDGYTTARDASCCEADPGRGASDELVTHELCHVWQMQHHPCAMPLSFLKTPLQQERVRARGALGGRPDARERVSVGTGPAAWPASSAASSAPTTPRPWCRRSTSWTRAYPRRPRPGRRARAAGHARRRSRRSGLVLRARRRRRPPRRRHGLRGGRGAGRAAWCSRWSGCSPSARSTPSGGGWWPRPASRPVACATSAREHGLYFPVNPGALEQSHIGGNAATNAGGPHSSARRDAARGCRAWRSWWRRGELVQLGGHTRKDVAGYDLVRLLVGSEGTLGVDHGGLAAADPRARGRYPILAVQRDLEGIAAIERVYASGAVPAAHRVPGRRDAGATPARRCRCRCRTAPGFAVLVEADGLREEAAAARERIVDALSEDAVAVHAPTDSASAEAVWRWREGVALAITPCAAASCPRTSPCRSTGSQEAIAESIDDRRPATACDVVLASGTPATATSTRTSSSTSTTRREVGRAEEACARPLRPRLPARRDGLGRARRGAAEGRPAAPPVGAEGRGAARRRQARRSTPRACSTPARSCA